MKSKNPLVIERHAYAPEMNKAYRIVNGKPVLIAKAGSGMVSGGFDDIASLRKRFRQIKQGIVATIKTHYPAEFKWLERSYCGYVESRAQALDFAAGLRVKLAEGGHVTIKTHIVG